jgi:hypothetical protein
LRTRHFESRADRRNSCVFSQLQWSFFRVNRHPDTPGRHYPANPCDYSLSSLRIPLAISSRSDWSGITLRRPMRVVRSLPSRASLRSVFLERLVSSAARLKSTAKGGAVPKMWDKSSAQESVGVLGGAGGRFISHGSPETLDDATHLRPLGDVGYCLGCRLA